MTKYWLLPILLLGVVVQAASAAVSSSPVRIKELVRIDGARDNALVGYGLVVGLSGTGDSQRSRATIQSLSNTLRRFGVLVDPGQLSARNVASVMVTLTLPAFANPGDRLDVNVACIGDARSLVGGTLLMTPLQGADERVYALAQGQLSIGGYRYDAFGNLIQKNHPTVGVVSGGAMVEAGVPNAVVTKSGSVHLLLNNPDYTTASRIAEALAQEFGSERLGADISAQGPDRVVFRLRDNERAGFVDVLRRIEAVTVRPDQAARVVVNERTGTVVAGGDVRLGSVSVTQGDLQVSIDTDYLVSQPSLLYRPSDSVRSLVVPDTTIRVTEQGGSTVTMPAGSTVAELTVALNKIKATPREVITILQAIQRAGALHAELVVQ